MSKNLRLAEGLNEYESKGGGAGITKSFGFFILYL